MITGTQTRKRIPIRIIIPKQVSLEGDNVTLIPVPVNGQLQNNWCWAACAQMSANFYGFGTQQCQLANYLHGQNSCCDNGSSPACDQGSPIDGITRVYSFVGINSTFVNAAIPFSTCQSEISGGRPVEVGIAWKGGGGHVILITGWATTSDGRQVLRINDPLPVGRGSQGGVTYQNMLTVNGYGSWQWSWVGIRRK